MVNFSADVRTKNEFTDVVFWLVSICSCGVNNVGVERDGNIFVNLRECLSIEQENKDLASYRQIVREGVYNCVIHLVEKNMAVLRQDNRGMEFPDNTESAEFLKLLRSQMVSSSLPGMILSMVNIILQLTIVTSFSFFSSANPKSKRKIDQSSSKSHVGKKQKKLPISK
jgi:type IV secretory pathway VirB4 component